MVIEFIEQLQIPYCELSSSFLPEPLNIFSNIGFFVVAYYSYRLLKKNTQFSIRLFPWFFVLIGLGSLSYHWSPGPQTFLADSLPIYGFILFSLYLLFRRSFSAVFSSLSFGAFILAEMLIVTLLPVRLNSFMGYFFALLIVLLLYLKIYPQEKTKTRPLAYALGLFAGGLLFRWIDLWACSFWPFGTHFVWHLLVASAGYFLVLYFSTESFASKNR